MKDLISSDEEFMDSLESLLNRHSIDSKLNMQDFLIAQLIAAQLDTLKEVFDERERLSKKN